VKKPMNIANSNNAWQRLSISTYQEKKPYLTISAMLYFGNAVKPDNQLKDKLFDLFDKYPNLSLYKLGFSNNWRQEDIWK